MPESAQKVIQEMTAAGLVSPDEVDQFDQEIQTGVDALLQRLVAEERITDYQAEKFKAGQSSDIYFGEYIVLQELGRGGMGTVLLARHLRMQRLVAIKILPTANMDSEAAVARFYQEVKVAAQLTHPNIVHAYDAGEHHGVHYLVMEYVKGHDLARMLQHMGPIPASLALDYILQAARGLEYAHRKGVVHRDIKPSNLLLDDEGNVKILDMGLARLGNDFSDPQAAGQLTITGQMMGTVEYMSPEQAEDTRNADARSDIYSLGCTLYRLVTGAAPYSRETVVKTILAHRDAPIPTLSSSENRELTNLDSFFERMVAKNPVDRFQNITQLVQELGQLIEDPNSLDIEQIPVGDVQIIDGDDAVGSTINHSSFNETGIEFTSEVQTPPPGMLADPVAISQPTIDASSASTDRSKPPVAPHGIQRGGVRVKQHRGGWLLMLSVLSVLFAFPCFIGSILGVITFLYSGADLREMRGGQRDLTGRNLTNAARVLSLIACIIGAAYLAISLLD